MSGQGGMFGGYPLASLFGQGQMGPIQPQMPPQGGGMSPFMQGASPQGAAPFMQGASPMGQAQPGIAPGANGPGAMSPLAKQMMMMKMMQNGGGQQPQQAGGAMGSPAVSPMMMMRSLGMMQ